MDKLYLTRVQYNINNNCLISLWKIVFISTHHLHNLGLVVTPATYQKPNKDAEILGNWIKMKH